MRSWSESRSGLGSKSRHSRLRGERSGRSRGSGGGGRDDNGRDNDDDSTIGESDEDGYNRGGGSRYRGNYNVSVGSADTGI